MSNICLFLLIDGAFGASGCEVTDFFSSVFQGLPMVTSKQSQFSIK